MRKGIGSGLVGMLLASCTPPTTEVRVDLSRVLAAETLPRPKPIELPKPPPALAPGTVRLPGRPRQVIPDPSTSRTEDVRRAIAEGQRRDYLRLLERLRTFYASEADALEREMRRELEGRDVAAYREAGLRIREIFERYADRRAPLVVRLALLVGFPDPNPRSLEPPTPVNRQMAIRLEEARQIRAELRAVEQEYDGQVAEVIGLINSEKAIQVQELIARLKRLREENDLRAEREASEQVRQTARALGLTLAEPVSPVLPPVAPSSVAVQGGPAPLPSPRVDSAGVSESPRDRRTLAERQLRIWLAQNRMVLDTEGRDVTDEFIRWRNDRLSGR